MAMDMIIEEVTSIEIQELPSSLFCGIYTPAKTFLVIRQAKGESVEIQIDWASESLLTPETRTKAITEINAAFDEALEPADA